MKRLLTFFMLMLVSFASGLAQGNETAKEATGLRADGKIYVVVVVVVVILLGLVLYIIRLDRKISKLEKKM